MYHEMNELHMFYHEINDVIWSCLRIKDYILRDLYIEYN